MSNSCPQCDRRLEEFAISCQCGWKAASESEVLAQRNAAAAPPKQPAAFTDQTAPASAPQAPPVSTNSIPRDARDRGPEPLHRRSASTNNQSKPKKSRTEIQELFDESMALIGDGQHVEALKRLNTAIEFANQDQLGECYSLLGYCHLQNQDFIQADQACSKAISLNCCDAQTYAWRAAARGERSQWRQAFDDLDLACSAAGDQRDSFIELMASYAESASEYLREKIKTGGESADLFFERGWVYYRCGRYAKAHRDFTLALEKHDQHSWAATGMAKLIFEERIHPTPNNHDGTNSDGQNSDDGNISEESTNHSRDKSIKEKQHAADQAIQYCNLGVAGEEACRKMALVMRARLHRDLGKFSKARSDLNRLVDLAKGRIDDVYQCCELQFELADAMGAVTQLSNLLEKEPSHQKSILLRGKCYAYVQNYALAAEDFLNYLRYSPLDVLARIELGKTYFAMNEVNLASETFEQVVQNDLGNFDAHLGLSKVFLKKKRLDLALTQCDKAIAIDSQNADAFATRAQIYQQRCDFAQTIDDYSRAVEIAADAQSKANYLYLRGVVYYETGQEDLALRDLKKSCRLRPHHVGALVWRAAACSRLERWADAIDCLNLAIELRPTASDAYRKLGQPVAKRAVKFFKNQLQRKNRDPKVYRNLALAHQFLHQFSDVAECLKSGLEEAPKNIDLLILRGQLSARQGDHEAANDDFTQAIRLDRRNHLARYHRSQSRLLTGNTDAAQRDIQKAIRINSLKPQYHLLLAKIYQHTKRPDQVIKCLDRALLVDTTDTTAYRLRGEAHIANQNYVAAVSDFTRSLELDASQNEILVLRGQAYAKDNQPKIALQDFELAATRQPTLVKAYIGRSQALAALGNYEEALIWITKAFHRFPNKKELADLVFTRGKIFYQANLYALAVVDFSTVSKLTKPDAKSVTAARYARGLARVQMDDQAGAEKDFKKVLLADPNHEGTQLAIDWLADPVKRSRPLFLQPPKHPRRPSRPAVVRSQVKLKTSQKDWRVEKPYDSWILRTLERNEYGPLTREVLDSWIEDGRIDFGMRILRADWPKWRRVEDVFSELKPTGNQHDGGETVQTFPELETRKPTPPAKL